MPVLGRRRRAPTTGTSSTSARWRCRGAAMFCIEATAVEAIGRITPGCLGLYNDANEAALRPIAGVGAQAFEYADRRSSSRMPAARRSSARAVGRRPADPAPTKAAGRPSRRRRCRTRPARRRRWRSMRRDWRGCATPFVAAARARRAARPRRHRAALRARLPAAPVPVADRRTGAPTHMAARCENRMRFPLEVFDAVRAALPGRQAGRRARLGDRLGRRRLGRRRRPSRSPAS